MVNRALALCAVAGSILMIPAAARGLDATDVAQGSLDISGGGCGAAGTASIRLPAGTLRAHIDEPPLGGPVYKDGHIVARVEARSIVTDPRGLLATFTARGSDDACDDPAAYPGGWSGYLDYYVRVRRRVQAYVSTRCLGRDRVRPRTIAIKCSRGAVLRFERLRWRTWGGRAARGRGRFTVNPCEPTCATGSRVRYAVRLTLTTARRCGHWRYLRMIVRPVDPGPTARSFSLPLFCPS
jgi:hypothetical protein